VIAAHASSCRGCGGRGDALRAAGEDHDSVATNAPVRGRPFFTGLAEPVESQDRCLLHRAAANSRATGSWGLCALVLIHAGLGLLWLSGYAYALNRARTFFERPRVRRTIDRLTGIVLFAFAIRLATERS
jgi:hypothetical protein